MDDAREKSLIFKIIPSLQDLCLNYLVMKLDVILEIKKLLKVNHLCSDDGKDTNTETPETQPGGSRSNFPRRLRQRSRDGFFQMFPFDISWCEFISYFDDDKEMLKFYRDVLLDQFVIDAKPQVQLTAGLANILLNRVLKMAMVRVNHSATAYDKKCPPVIAFPVMHAFTRSNKLPIQSIQLSYPVSFQLISGMLCSQQITCLDLQIWMSDLIDLMSGLEHVKQTLKILKLSFHEDRDPKPDYLESVGPYQLKSLKELRLKLAPFLREIHIIQGKFLEFMCECTSHSETLSTVELSNATLYTDVDIGWLTTLTNLEFLFLPNIIFDVNEEFEWLTKLCSLHKLRHLDISQSNTIYEPSLNIDDIVEMFPNLTSIDVSGTNMCWDNRADFDCNKPCSILLSERLKYVGMVNCGTVIFPDGFVPSYDSTHFTDISSFLSCLMHNMENSKMLNYLIDDFMDKFCQEDTDFSMENTADHLKLVIMLMNIAQKYMVTGNDALIKKSCHVLDYYLFRKGLLKTVADDIQLMVSLITTLTSVIQTHIHKKFFEIICICMQTLARMQLREALVHGHLFCFLGTVLCNVMKLSPKDQYINHSQNISLNIIHSMCRMEQQYKLQVIKRTPIMQMLLGVLNLWKEKTPCHRQAEKAWNIFWSLTDDNSEVSKLVFHHPEFWDLHNKYFKIFLNDPPILKKLTGVIINFSDVKELRLSLLSKNIVNDLCNLLDPGNLCVSYHVIGVMAALLSEGPAIWTLTDPSRESVISLVIEQVEKWDIKEDLKVRYRSLQPMLDLIQVQHTEACRMYGLWALGNLLHTNAARYIQMLKQEGGVTIIQSFKLEENLHPISWKLWENVLHRI